MMKYITLTTLIAAAMLAMSSNHASSKIVSITPMEMASAYACLSEDELKMQLQRDVSAQLPFEVKIEKLEGDHASSFVARMNALSPQTNLTGDVVVIAHVFTVVVATLFKDDCAVSMISLGESFTALGEYDDLTKGLNAEFGEVVLTTKDLAQQGDKNHDNSKISRDGTDHDDADQLNAKKGTETLRLRYVKKAFFRQMWCSRNEYWLEPCCTSTSDWGISFSRDLSRDSDDGCNGEPVVKSFFENLSSDEKARFEKAQRDFKFADEVP